jgi:hypothetical protein
MTPMKRRWFLLVMVAGVAGMTGSLPVNAAPADELLRWDTAGNRVTADVQTWRLPALLERIAEATSWEVFVEPETDLAVSAKFADQPAGEALRRLLGDLNFALLPQTNAPARLFIYRTSLQEATQRVQVVKKRRGSTADPIPNELVVALKPGADINDIARRLGAKVVGSIDELGVHRLQFEDEAAAKTASELLSGYKDVAELDANFYVERPPGADLLAASSSAPFSLNPAVGGDGNSVIVGEIDTRIQMKGSPISDLLLEALSVFGGSGAALDYSLTHATSMANGIGQGLSSILEGKDTTVRILPVDVYGNNVNATTFDVAHGIVLAIQNGATIINLSLGSEGNSSLLATVIKNGTSKGVAFVAAAGNQPVTTPFYPAAYPEVLAATAGDRRGNIAPYANYGSFVDVVAPGANIVQYNGRGYLVSGTSTSSAYVSGLVAGLVSQGGLTPAEAAQRVRTVLAAPVAGK